MDKSNKKNRELFNKYLNGTRAADWMIYLYLFAVFGIYTWITDDAYFNITMTRYEFISTATYAFIVLFVIAIAIEKMIEYALLDEIISINRIVDKKKFWKRPDFWAMAFLMANIFAYIVSIDKATSMMGSNGRYMGCLTYVFLCVMFVFIANRLKPDMLIISIFGITSAFAYIVAIFQHAGIDFMSYKDRIAKSNYHIFTSTFGNINVFASFICISMPMFIAIYIFYNKNIRKIFMALLIILGGMSTIISNSDSVYLGVGAALCVIFLLSFYNSKTKAFFETLIMFATGNIFVVIMRNLFECEYDKKRGGVAEILDEPKIAIGLLVGVCLLYGIVLLLDKKFGQRLVNINRKKIIIYMIVFVGVLFIIFIVAGILLKISIFEFNYEWGTYRGFIWTKCIEIFGDAPVVNKIFGYGNETLRLLTHTHCYEEMIEVTGKSYDNAHNELIQYLVTTGIVGVVSYIGMFVSSVTYMIKNANKEPIVLACAASACGYFVQGLININQPITTPLFFVVLAVGVGCARYKERLLLQEN